MEPHMTGHTHRPPMRIMRVLSSEVLNRKFHVVDRLKPFLYRYAPIGNPIKGEIPEGYWRTN